MPIIADPHNPKALLIEQALLRHWDAVAIPLDLNIVLGGDGFMLRTILNSTTTKRTFLGLNCGRVGFLMNDLPEDLSSIPRLAQAPLRTFDFPRIKMEATTTDGKNVQALAVNDIYLERMSGQTAHLKIDINGATVVERLVSDGLICSTALGSTGYHFSAGGSACHPTLPVMGVAPICPHAPMLRPIVVPLAARISLTVLQADRRPVRAVCDGYDYENVIQIQIRNAESPIRFAFLPEHTFTRTLIRKLLQ